MLNSARMLNMQGASGDQGPSKIIIQGHGSSFILSELCAPITGRHTKPGKPAAQNSGVPSTNCGLLRGIVANYVGLLGFPGTCEVLVAQFKVRGSGFEVCIPRSNESPGMESAWELVSCGAYVKRLQSSSYCQCFRYIQRAWILRRASSIEAMKHSPCTDHSHI